MSNCFRRITTGRPSTAANAALNEFLRRQARQNADRNLGVTHIVVAAAGESRVLGDYTLVIRTVESAIVPLAVDRNLQRQGIGKLMLMRALRQTEDAARAIGIVALILDAVDEAARE